MVESARRTSRELEDVRQQLKVTEEQRAAVAQASDDSPHDSDAASETVTQAYGDPDEWAKRMLFNDSEGEEHQGKRKEGLLKMKGLPKTSRTLKEGAFSSHEDGFMSEEPPVPTTPPPPAGQVTKATPAGLGKRKSAPDADRAAAEAAEEATPSLRRSKRRRARDSVSKAEGAPESSGSEQQ